MPGFYAAKISLIFFCIKNFLLMTFEGSIRFYIAAKEIDFVPTPLINADGADIINL